MTFTYEGHGYQDYKGKSQSADMQLLRQMVRIREIELALASRYHEDEMKTPIHLMVGQEATVVGACAAMEIQDKVYLSHRTHGPYLAKGGDLHRMVAELYGKVAGCSGSRGGSMHLIDKSVGVDGASAIVGGIVPIATGAALASQRLGTSNLTTVFFGDAAMEEGVLAESLNMAALWKLPVLYFCENNYYSVCTPLHKRQAPVSLAGKAAAFGVPTVKVDGNNIYAVRSAVAEARARALRGEGPSFIEAQVYRWLAHAGATDDTSTGYRTQQEVDSWKTVCPIQLFREFLIDEKVVTEKAFTGWQNETRREMQQLMEQVRQEPYPDRKTLLQHVYAP